MALGAPAGGGDKAEVEGLQAGLDWYGTNEHSAALFLTGQQLTTSDSEGDDDEQMGGDGEEDDEGSDGEAGGGGGGDDAALPRGVRARLVEQEAYIAELEDQNLRCVQSAAPKNACWRRRKFRCRPQHAGSLHLSCLRASLPACCAAAVPPTPSCPFPQLLFFQVARAAGDGAGGAWRRACARCRHATWRQRGGLCRAQRGGWRVESLKQGCGDAGGGAQLRVAACVCFVAQRRCHAVLP